MAAFTLADLIAKARTRADMPNSTFVSDAEVTEFVNSGYTELYELLVATFEDYFISSTVIALIANTDTYDLSAFNVMKGRGVDLLINATQPGNFIPLQRYQWSERENYVGMGTGIGSYTANGQRLKYNFFGSNLVLAPVPDGAYSLKVWFVPNCPRLVNPTDPLLTEVKPGWEEYIVCDAAIQMLSKEQNDVSYLVARKAALKKRIEEMASNRDAEQPPRAVRRLARRYPFQADDGEVSD